jgi:uncharacterized protein YyaL (SSP411 family)
MKKLNHLSNQKSPYLLQHADNPVDWYPWCEEAFERAKKEDKPVFLSIGYSTCHWCHVMERESFKDEEIAGLMNDTFVSIKVDREERPDIDGIYMLVCQMLTGSGGWPLTIVMKPDKRPFFAGTYFPRESRFGRAGMKEIISGLKEIWLNKREEINNSAWNIVNTLNKNVISAEKNIEENIFEKAFNEFKRRFDNQFGGFGTAPKFPSPHNFYFLLRYYKKYTDEVALIMVEKTLLEMRRGGIYDHIGFGFHRYSTDREWLVPHFEKMLYDQALLTIAYTELYQVTNKEIYHKTVKEILGYILRDMTSPESGFYSAEDADSEGKEGKFYLWSTEEIRNILGEETELISKVFNLKDEGNFTGEEAGGIIFHLKKSFKEIAEDINISENILNEKIENARRKLFEVRKKRIHPYKDDKILTDWNGLMISAFSKASQVFNDNVYEESAVKASEFILEKLRDKEGKLLHRYRENEAGIPASLDDYSFFIMGLIDLYEATFNVRWLKTAIELNKDLITHFWDEENGGFFFSPDYGEKLIVRQKEIYDGAVPSGNSVEILNLLKLGRITGNSSFEEKAFKIANIFSDKINQMPSAFSQTLASLNFGFGESFEIVIVGEKDNRITKEIIRYFRTGFSPNKVILLKEPGDQELKNIAPFTEYQTQIDNKTTVYICRNYVCEKPVTSLNEIKEIFK